MQAVCFAREGFVLVRLPGDEFTVVAFWHHQARDFAFSIVTINLFESASSYKLSR